MAVVHIGILLFIIFLYSRIHVIISLTHHGDGVALQALKNSWENTPATWNLSNDPCDSWDGVTCSNSRVTQLILRRTKQSNSPGLKGKLSGVIGDLTELKLLILPDNKYLTGALPPQLGNLRNLDELSLLSCSFTGSIPDELGNLIELSTLNLMRNKLKGKIPPFLGKLSKLSWLALSHNQLSGKLPVSTGKTPGLDLLLKLEGLILSDNKYLTGSLPPQLGNLSNLNVILLDRCSFTGNIPDELGNLSGLSILELSGNNLRGKIPPSLGKLSKLDFLNLAQNQLSGRLPVSTENTPGLDLLVKAEGFNFSHNKLSGRIPSKFFGPNMKLKLILMNQNALSGEIPSTISNLTNLAVLELSHNTLSGVLPDLSKLASLKILSLSNNSFDAHEAPTWFSTLPSSLTSIEMEYGSLRGLVPAKLFSLPTIQHVKLRNNAFNGTLTISGANISSQLRLVDLQNNQISSVTFDSNSTTLMLAGNPICAKAPPNTNYCHEPGTY